MSWAAPSRCRSISTFHSETDCTDLCPTNADWIVEKYSQAYADSAGHVSFQKIPIVNMGTVTFTNTSATTVDGKLVDGWNARTNVIDLVQDGHKLLASTIEDSFINVSYVRNGRT